jgi:hypothetical protein
MNHNMIQRRGRRVSFEIPSEHHGRLERETESRELGR